MKYNIWFDKIEGNWNVSVEGDAMPVFEAYSLEECQQYVTRQLILAKYK